MNELLGFFLYMLSAALAVAFNAAAVFIAVSATNSFAGVAVLILTIPASMTAVLAVLGKVA